MGRLASHAGRPHATSGRHLVRCQNGNPLEERQQAEAGRLGPAAVSMADSERVPLSSAHGWDGRATLWP